MLTVPGRLLSATVKSESHMAGYPVPRSDSETTPVAAGGSAGGFA